MSIYNLISPNRTSFLLRREITTSNSSSFYHIIFNKGSVSHGITRSLSSTIKSSALTYLPSEGQIHFSPTIFGTKYIEIPKYQIHYKCTTHRKGKSVERQRRKVTDLNSLRTAWWPDCLSWPHHCWTVWHNHETAFKRNWFAARNNLRSMS